MIGRRCADLLAVEVEGVVDLDIGHHDREHLLVDVNSCDSVRHRSLLGRAESVPRRISQGSSVPVELDDAQLLESKHCSAQDEVSSGRHTAESLPSVDSSRSPHRSIGRAICATVAVAKDAVSPVN